MWMTNFVFWHHACSTLQTYSSLITFAFSISLYINNLQVFIKEGLAITIIIRNAVTYAKLLLISKLLFAPPDMQSKGTRNVTGSEAVDLPDYSTLIC